MSDVSYVTSSQKSHSMPGIAFAGLMEAVLEKNVPFRFTATGCSMTPFIRDGDLITISPVPLRLRPGDVVPFVNPSCNKLMVHRILNVSQEGYLIKGDNNSEPDGRIPASSIIGRVVRVEHRGRQVRFGLGTESFLIAWLSQCCWLTPLVWSVRRVIKPFAGKWIV
jgi:signal peptidase I